MSVTFDNTHLVVFVSQEAAEVFLWEVRSAVPAAESVPAWGWVQFQIQDRQHKCVVSSASDAVLPRELCFGCEGLGQRQGSELKHDSMWGLVRSWGVASSCLMLFIGFLNISALVLKHRTCLMSTSLFQKFRYCIKRLKGQKFSCD